MDLPSQADMQYYWNAIQTYLKIQPDSRCPLCKKGRLTKDRKEDGSYVIDCSNCQYHLELKPPIYIQLQEYLDQQKKELDQKRYELYQWFMEKGASSNKKYETYYEQLQKECHQLQGQIQSTEEKLNRQQKTLETMEKQMSELSIELYTQALLRKNSFPHSIHLTQSNKKKLIEIYKKEAPLTANRKKALEKEFKIDEIGKWIEWFETVVSYKKSENMFLQLEKQYQTLIETVQRENRNYPIEKPKVVEILGTTGKSLLTLYNKKEEEKEQEQKGGGDKIEEEEEPKEPTIEFGAVDNGEDTMKHIQIPMQKTGGWMKTFLEMNHETIKTPEPDDESDISSVESVESIVEEEEFNKETLQEIDQNMTKATEQEKNETIQYEFHKVEPIQKEIKSNKKVVIDADLRMLMRKNL